MTTTHKHRLLLLLLSTMLLFLFEKSSAQEHLTIEKRDPGKIDQQLKALKMKQADRNVKEHVRYLPQSSRSTLKNNERTTYVFTGKGSWFNPDNWENNMLPPAQLKAGEHIIINGAGPCMLSSLQPILLTDGSTLEIKEGKQLYLSVGNSLVIRGGNLVNDGNLQVLSGKLPNHIAQEQQQTGVIRPSKLSPTKKAD